MPIHLCIVANKRGCFREILQNLIYLLRRFLLPIIGNCIDDKRKWLVGANKCLKLDLRI